MDAILDHSFQRVFGWALLWFTLYRTFCKILRNRHPEYNCRIVTLLHATLITITSCYITFFYGTNPFTILGSPNTPPQLLIITISLGYFLYDFAWCMYHQTEGPVMLLHHVISISFMTVCLYLGVSGVEVVGTIFGSEVTSIILNVRWFIKEHDLYNDKLMGFVVDLLFVALFLVVRIGVGGYLVYSVVLSTKSPYLVKMGGLAFYGVNCIFFAQILSFSRHRLKKWLKSSKTVGETVSNGDCKKSHTNGFHSKSANIPEKKNGLYHGKSEDCIVSGDHL